VSTLLTAPDLGSVTDPADPALRSVVRLLADSVPASCAGLVAYHASGYRRFLQAALAPPAAARTVILRCIRLGDEVRAVADWRLLDRQLFLNGIATRATERGRGYGRRLLDDGLAVARQLNCTTVALDVSLENARARQLYQRMGFADRSTAAWANTVGGWPADAPEIRILDWPSFAAHRSAYGFGDLRVSTFAGTAAVRLVGGAMRVAAGRHGGAVAAALSQMVGAERVYAMGAAPDEDEVFASFTRMERPVDIAPC
jgi:ribosomal protein S18 acetylase RimI-like enzyme